MPRNLLQIGLWTAIFAGSAVAQSTLTGRVLALADGDRTPAAGAWVVAASGSPSRTVASAQADAQGVYRLAGLPEGRVEFTVSHRGYFTYQAGGATAETLARACPADGSCGEAEFVVAQALVVEGYVSNPFGDPLADATVILVKAGERPEPELRGRRGGFGRTRNITDDRGYFRFYGVTPAEYRLDVKAGRFDDIYTTEPLEVSVVLGESNSPLYVAMNAAEQKVLLRVGGVIDGLNLQGGETVRILAATANYGAYGIRVDAEDEAAPRLSGQLPQGDYVLIAEVIDDAGRGRRGPGRVVSLGRHRIDADNADLRVAARPAATFSGRIQFENMEPQRANLRLVPLDGGTPDALRFGSNGRYQGFAFGPGGRQDTRFERAALLPGRYRLEANSNDYFITSPTEFNLSEGETLQAEIVLSGAFGEIRGVVRPPAEGAGAGRFLVALRDEAGKVVAIQTDTSGQYSFAKLRPGDYQICSWVDVTVNTQDEQTWEAAGTAAKRFPIAAGDDTEILLTAKP